MTPPLDIHLIAIGGTGMAPLACLLREQGHLVRGSDGPLYPPMSTLLEQAGIVARVGYEPAHLDPAPDLVIVGNAIRHDNPQATTARELELEIMSMPQALTRFFLRDRQPLVVAGTHGKTTTTSMAAWVYKACDRDPGFLIGGVPQNLDRSFAIGSGRRFIIEGDEYNAAYFDRGPKFLHYQPQTAILTSVEYDHADLYAEPEDLLAAYSRLVAILPADGLLVAHGDSPDVRAVAALARCPVVYYGFEKSNDIRPLAFGHEGGGTYCRLPDAEVGEVELRLRTTGRHNLLNAMAVWVVARRDGIGAAVLAEAFSRFDGVRRRQEELGTAAGITVVDDFAHHPTAVGETLPALRERYPGRRLVVAFEPRSLTAGREMFFDAYVNAFASADAVFFAPLFHADRLSEGERLDLERLAGSLAECGVDAAAHSSVPELRQAVLAALDPGDVLVTMSSGSFEGIPHEILAELRRR
ncbi:MAG: Mur ligase family protein [Acidobacteria bacterium]|nr:Mur ligase family protein [Acidobacteriota bacterium]